MKTSILFSSILLSASAFAQTWDVVDSIAVVDPVWDKARVDVSSSDDIFLSFESINSGSPLLKSSDAGQTWSTVKANFQRGYIGFDSQDNMYIVSEKKYSAVAKNYFDTLYYSTDLGATLQTVDQVPNNDWNRASFYIDASDQFYSTGPGSGPSYAREWRIYNGATLASSMYGPYDIYSKGQRSIIKLSNGNFVVSSYNSGIRYSTDGGSTWVESQGDGVLGTITFEGFVEADNGNLILGGATIVECADGGETWTSSSLGQNFIGAVVKASNGTIYAMAVYNTLYASDDDGATWNAVANTPSGTYADMAVSDNYVYIIIDNVLYRTAITGGSGIGLAELSTSDLNIHPNPSAGDVRVTMPASFTTGKLRVLDMMGRTVYEGAVQNDEEVLPREVFPNTGIYTLQIWNDTERQVHVGRVQVY